MNLAEHPLALDLNREIDESDKDYIPATLLLPGMPQLMGELRRGHYPGLFILTTNVKLGDSGETGRVDFKFTADKAVSVLRPSIFTAEEGSRIVSPH